MVTRAFAVLGVGDAFEAPALDVMARLDALVDEGEPIVSAYRVEQDGPWTIDILFMDLDAAARERWLAAARDLVPTLPALQFDALAERDWVAESQKALHPVHAGRFVVYGAHDADRLPPSRWRIQIDAGRAFGTAHHATTMGCLIALERVAKRSGLGSVHDVGTGTGILAIAANRLGAAPVSGGDIDPVAVRVARGNVAANRTSGPIALRTAAGAWANADTVIANILARPLIALANNMSQHTGRTLILSGLRSRDVRRVTAAYAARGFVVDARVVIEDWATLTLKRKRAARKGRPVDADRPKPVD